MYSGNVILLSVLIRTDYCIMDSIQLNSKFSFLRCNTTINQIRFLVTIFKFIFNSFIIYEIPIQTNELFSSIINKITCWFHTPFVIFIYSFFNAAYVIKLLFISELSQYHICSRNKYLFLIKLRYKEKDQIIRPLYNRLDRQLKCINDKINANI